MFGPFITLQAALLLPLAIIIIYYDVRYRRIPNIIVLATLICGLAINIIFGGFAGLLTSLGGFALAFGLMFLLHVFGAMGAGDVKLFAAIGSVIGVKLVLPTFIIIVITGGILAIIQMIRARSVRSTMHNVMMIFFSLLPGWKMPRHALPTERRFTIPYGVAIMVGSLISLIVARA